MIYFFKNKKEVYYFDQSYQRKIAPKGLDFDIGCYLYDELKCPVVVQVASPNHTNGSIAYKLFNQKMGNDFSYWFYIEPATARDNSLDKDRWWHCSENSSCNIKTFFVCDRGLENQFENTEYLDAYLIYEYEKQKHIVEKLDDKNIEYKFLCLNTKIKPHRSAIVEHLLNDYKEDSFCTYTDSSILQFQVPSVFEYYDKAAVAVVNETCFYSMYQNYSEKTIDCILTGTPFVLAAPPGTLSLLHNHGFKTFNDYWNESYDTICDHEERLLAIKKTIYNIGKKSNEELEEMLVDMQNIRLYNLKNIKNIGTRLKQELERFVQ